VSASASRSPVVYRSRSASPSGARNATAHPWFSVQDEFSLAPRSFYPPPNASPSAIPAASPACRCTLPPVERTKRPCSVFLADNRRSGMGQSAMPGPPPFCLAIALQGLWAKSYSGRARLQPRTGPVSAGSRPSANKALSNFPEIIL
jgi:hypothetical protein